MPRTEHNTSSLPEDLLVVASRAARLAGNHARENRARRNDTLSVARHDIKLALDVECQEIATAALARACPGHCIMGEESASRDIAGEWVWIIDPIDGTVNFSHGKSVWCCSVALLHKGAAVAGAIYAPDLDLLFEAFLGGGSRCNGKTIRASRVDRLEQALVHTGADKEESGDGGARPHFSFFKAIAEKVQRPRISGSAALDLCEVARGTAEAYFEPMIHLWDIAAGALIIEEAGGCTQVVARRGPVSMSFIGAGNTAIRDQMHSLVAPLLENDSQVNSK